MNHLVKNRWAWHLDVDDVVVKTHFSALVEVAELGMSPIKHNLLHNGQRSQGGGGGGQKKLKN